MSSLGYARQPGAPPLGEPGAFGGVLLDLMSLALPSPRAGGPSSGRVVRGGDGLARSGHRRRRVLSEGMPSLPPAPHSCLSFPLPVSPIAATKRPCSKQALSLLPTPRDSAGTLSSPRTPIPFRLSAPPRRLLHAALDAVCRADVERREFATSDAARAEGRRGAASEMATESGDGGDANAMVASERAMAAKQDGGRPVREDGTG